MAQQIDEGRLAGILQDLPLLDHMDGLQVARILSICKQREVRPGEVLCEPQTIDQQLFVLVEGRLRLETAEGKKVTELAPVRSVGEMGVLTGLPRSSRIAVEEVSLVLEVKGADLEELCEEDPEMGQRMMVNLVRILYDRIHGMNEDLGLRQQQVALLRQRVKELAPDDPLLRDI
jgi:CRP-like cAMP-binding protein